jgi:type II secretory ATPase GspE/PulE/Tfp pilus assembly ATPase PilB-like protein
MTLKLPDKKLKEILVDGHLISLEAFNSAKEEAKRTGSDLASLLVSRGLITNDYLYKIYSDFFQTPLVKLRGRPIKKEILSLLPEEIARAKRIVVFDKDAQGTIFLAMEDPSDLETISFTEKYIGSDVKPFLVLPEEINYVFSLYGEEVVEDFKKIIEENVSVSTRKYEDKKSEKDIAVEVPIVNIINNILNYAISLDVSDIHIEIFQENILIRFRIDGILHEIIRIDKKVHPAIVARVKLLANLKIDEHQKPQDGRFRYEIFGEMSDIRVSVMPTLYGEKVELRLLKSTAKPMSLSELGMLEDVAKIVSDSIKKTYGMILITGPTGSGKTTTLYSILNILNKPSVNIVTIEDPIEYDIKYINQTQINPIAGIDFSNGLRSMLRQDPDIIMVGEIRDEETAAIAVHSALTGHLLLSSLHTNDAPTAIPRMIDMKTPPFLIGAVLNTVIAQRLVRKICNNCIQSYVLTKDELDTLKYQIETFTGGKEIKIPKELYKGVGCEVCGNTGYRGRMGIFEILELDEEMRRMINKPDFSLESLRKRAKEKGMITMLEDGLMKAKLGLTTIEEILRVIRE